MYTVRFSSLCRNILLMLSCCFTLFACNGGDDTSSPADDTAVVDPGANDPSNEPLPTLSVPATLTVEEQQEPIGVAITLSTATSTSVTVNYRLLSDSALAESDFVAATQSITFDIGEIEKIISVQLIDDLINEPLERFSLEIFAASGATISSSISLISIIANDDYDFPERIEFDAAWDVNGAFAPASSCGNCHQGANDSSGVLRLPQTATGKDISPYAGWQHDAMAHALNDPYYLAVVEEETLHFPDLKGTIEDKCLSCHAPMAHYTAHLTETNLTLDNCVRTDGCYGMDVAQLNMTAREGVSCTLCHQIDPVTVSPTVAEKVTINTELLSIYGPYDDVVRGAMRNNTQYEVKGGAHMQGSSLCAVCHNLKAPSIDINNDQLLSTTLVEQAPYTEWLNSTFNEGNDEDKQCQTCHMPQITDYETQIATTANGNANANWPVRTEYSQHQFLGGNTSLPQLLRDYDEQLGIANSTSETGFDDVIARNRKFLTSHAASVELTSVDVQNSELTFDVKVVNHSGHKLPTSFPSRRVWLSVTVSDPQDNILFSSGVPSAFGAIAVDAFQASDDCVLASNIADNNDACYSHHIDTVTSSQQIPVYESVMADSNQHVTYVLLHGVNYLKDNRIPPEGFSTSSERYNSEVAIIGAANQDPDFNRENSEQGSGSDVVHYQLDWSGLADNELTVDVKLYYQSIKPAFITGMTHHGDKVDQFKWMAAQHPPQPEVLASTTTHLSY
ncbi:Calx-beta domain-containing protein [Shewanella algicola]|uniref:Calx-beta domain-containing protein n=1 Tax=Shewanella algicola TaxID=640633 RepID=A0A9X1Z3E1_9GAMM|nr:Calx-beta domain-containing protein [Shewanella algicola]MCL1104373.1 hypothetical protein [Shewanella algicola]